MKFLKVLNRFKEPSTWATITALAAVGGAHIDDTTIKAVMDGCALGSGLLGIFVSEGVQNGKGE